MLLLIVYTLCSVVAPPPAADPWLNCSKTTSPSPRVVCPLYVYTYCVCIILYIRSTLRVWRHVLCPSLDVVVLLLMLALEHSLQQQQASAVFHLYSSCCSCRIISPPIILPRALCSSRSRLQQYVVYRDVHNTLYCCKYTGRAN